MNKSFLGVLLYFAVVFPAEYILIEVFGLDSSEDRWLIWGISLPTALTVAILGVLLAHLWGKRKKPSE